MTPAALVRTSDWSEESSVSLGRRKGKRSGQARFGMMHRKAVQPALETVPPLEAGKPSRPRLQAHLEHKPKRHLYLNGNQVPGKRRTRTTHRRIQTLRKPAGSKAVDASVGVHLAKLMYTVIRTEQPISAFTG